MSEEGRKDEGDRQDSSWTLEKDKLIEKDILLNEKEKSEKEKSWSKQEHQQK